MLCVKFCHFHTRHKLLRHFVLDCPAPFCYLNKTLQKEVITLILTNIVQDTTMARAENTLCSLQVSCKGVQLDYLLPFSRVGSQNVTAAGIYIAHNKGSTDILSKCVIFCRAWKSHFSHFQTEDSEAHRQLCTWSEWHSSCLEAALPARQLCLRLQSPHTLRQPGSLGWPVPSLVEVPTASIRGAGKTKGSKMGFMDRVCHRPLARVEKMSKLLLKQVARNK